MKRTTDEPTSLRLAPRCGAKTRGGTPCHAAAMPNGRCRMHGGGSPGAPKGNQNALKHGRYTAEAIARRHKVAALIQALSCRRCSMASQVYRPVL